MPDVRLHQIRYAVLAAVIAAAIALISLEGCARPMTAAPDRQAEEKRVLATEDAYVAAEVARDEVTLRRLVDDRFSFNSSRGTTTKKEELIQGVLKMNMVGQAIKERSVLVEGNVALVFGTIEIRFASPSKPETISTLRYTSTYVNRQGQWRMLALQMQQRAQ